MYALNVADEIRFDWDDANLHHIARHDVMREEAEQVLMNEPVDLDFEYLGEEPRWAVLGRTETGRLLVVIFTERGPALRVVTAFDATKHEQRVYFERKREVR